MTQLGIFMLKMLKENQELFHPNGVGDLAQQLKLTLHDQIKIKNINLLFYHFLFIYK